MTSNKSGSSSAEIAKILADMNKKGEFSIAVLTNRDGFPIASAALPDQDPLKQAAVVALIQKTAAQVSAQLGMTQTDEISLFDNEGQRLVCRPFTANGHELILAVLIPSKIQSYRRLTNNMVAAIQRRWNLKPREG